MTTVQATKEPRLRGVSPTPSKIPVRSQRPPLLPAGKPSTLYQENQDPKRLMQKPLESAGSRPKAISQTEKSVGTTQLRNPLEELRLSSGVQNVGPGPPPLTEAPGTIEFVADPAALATILSGEGVKSCRLGRQPSLAQRVLVRGSQRRILQRDQGARASAYLAPRTPNHQLAYARASCFSRLEGPGPRGQTLCPQRLKTLNPPSGLSFHSSTRPSFLELRRVTGGSNRTSVNQTSGLPLETPTQPASSLPEGEHPEDRGGSLCLAQRVPLKGTHTKDSCDSHLMPSPAPVAQRIPGRVVPSSVTCPSPFGLAQHVPSPHPQAPASYSVLRRLALRPKTQFTPIPSISRVQQSQGQCMSDLSPATRPEPEELFLPWEQIAVQLFDQQSSVGLQEPPVASNVLPRNRTPNPQELKMQRISILQKLLRQEVEGLAEDKYVSLNGGSSLDMVELPPLLSRISGTLNTPEHNSGTSHLPELQHSELPKPCLPDKCGKPQPCPPTEPGVPDSCHGRESEISEPSPQQQPGIAEPCPLAEPQPLQHSSQGNAGLPEPHPRVEPETPEACPVEPRRPESTQQSHNNQCAPVPTSLISSQHPPCASHPVHSLQSLRHPPHQSGPNSLAPRTLALRQRLRACLTAIHCFHETRLDDECAFYTSRASPSGPTRVCTNPVATLLEWQDALSFIPVDSAASQGSPS
ncbi:PREDICTED: tastin [Chrysochloris asiatica]|uniref:Tastin n=1 Tax=Chrysochloris asiatica TaxID=185453 RepID=A0A9B0TSS4_CHRAS|nr:PREDICTED: tastin [Chrysochloris asiatica]